MLTRNKVQVSYLQSSICSPLQNIAHTTDPMHKMKDRWNTWRLKPRIYFHERWERSSEQYSKYWTEFRQTAALLLGTAQPLHSHLSHKHTHTHTHTHYCLKKIAKEHEVARQSTAIYAQKIYIYTAIHVVYLAHERSTDSCTWGHS